MRLPKTNVIYLLSRQREINRLRGSTLNMSYSAYHFSAVFLNHIQNLSPLDANIKYLTQTTQILGI